MRFYVRLLLICAVLSSIGFPLSKRLQSAIAKQRSQNPTNALCAGTVKTPERASGLLADSLRVFAALDTDSSLRWEASFGAKHAGLRTMAGPSGLRPNSAALKIVGLPSDDSRQPLRSPLAPAQIVEVSVNNNFFSPQIIHVMAGDTVRWTWIGVAHTVTSGACCDADDTFCSPSNFSCGTNPTSGPGTVYSYQFNTPGTFNYFCNVHLGAMTGRVIVDPAQAGVTLQFSASNYDVGEGGVSATVTVTRGGDTSGTSTVDFLTSDGTATQAQDYIVASGTLSFAAGETSKTFAVLIVDDGFIESNEALNLTLSNPTGATLAAPSSATVTISDNDTAGSTSPALKRFFATLDGAQETPANNSPAKGTGLVLLNQSETAAMVGLQFQSLGSAETAAHIHGNGAPGVMAPIIFPLTPPIVNPLVNFAISPTAQQVADLKAGLHYQNVHSVNFGGGEIRGQLRWNPTLEENFFVRQQYLDFLSRDGDAGGFSFWVNQVSSCQANAQCFHDRTISTSDAFFFEPEFQQTAGYVFRAYRAAFGNSQPFPNPDGSNATEANKLIDYPTSVADRARVVGGANLATAQQDFANLFVARAAFTTKYAAAASAAQFVDAILATIQGADAVDLSAQRQALIDQYNNAGGGPAGRARVLYRLADDNALNPINNQAFINAEYNRQFALTLYFGYLRRNPDIGGFLFWQSQINLAPVRDVPKQNALVCSFITAAEYQFRFGANAPRSNTECPQ